ncbi:Hypothetical protein NTJ_02509 [Nesidiocoris tenuis]|uniref:Uncharacterized protein n=1 Tax=Nesidiocoris tenuis TaxID=355587 RepID=A0ABN7AEM9_9HEMI|nr:Hypothetical protein NTJ_02509 [Nesidiocoris tenuis]
MDPPTSDRSPPRPLPPTGPRLIRIKGFDPMRPRRPKTSSLLLALAFREPEQNARGVERLSLRCRFRMPKTTLGKLLPIYSCSSSVPVRNNIIE